MNTISHQEPLQDYEISYMDDNTISCQEPLQDYKISYNERLLNITKIFFHPLYNTKKFLLPYFQHIPFFQQILI